MLPYASLDLHKQGPKAAHKFISPLTQENQRQGCLCKLLNNRSIDADVVAAFYTKTS